jgi:glycosyltransferase involved in cell wall biosynthesis
MPPPEARGDGPLPVLYVNHTGHTGGAEKSLLRLLECLNRQQVRPLLAAPPGPSLAAAATALDVPLSPVPLTALHRTLNPLSLAAQGWALSRAGRHLAAIGTREQVALVHCNSLVAMLAARPLAARVPLVWHARDLRAPEGAIVRAVEAATMIIAISRTVADHVLDLAPHAATKLAVVYNGITRQDVMVERSREDVRREWRLTPNVRLVGCVAQLVAWKRHDLFLRAGARLIAHLPDVRLLVVGADPHGANAGYADSLRRLAVHLGISDRLIWAGHRDDMADVLATLDVLIHPPPDEPFGRVVLEALALGVPVVAADSAGPAEIIEHRQSGLLVTPGEADALFQAARRVLADADLAEVLRTGGVRRARHFLARDSAELTVELYHQMLRARETEAWRWSA